jgi:hypothetical protein
MRVDPCSCRILDFRTPHLHPLPLRKGRGEKFRTPDCLLRVTLPEAIVIVRDARALPYQNIECFHQARLVTVTHGRLAIWLDPFGMLDSQILVNLLPQVCVGTELVKHNNRLVILVPRLSRERLK